jgi:hypothetical protein
MTPLTSTPIRASTPAASAASKRIGSSTVRRGAYNGAVSATCSAASA